MNIQADSLKDLKPHFNFITQALSSLT